MRGREEDEIHLWISGVESQRLAVILVHTVLSINMFVCCTFQEILNEKLSPFSLVEYRSDKLG